MQWTTYRYRWHWGPVCKDKDWLRYSCSSYVHHRRICPLFESCENSLLLVDPQVLLSTSATLAFYYFKELYQCFQPPWVSFVRQYGGVSRQVRVFYRCSPSWFLWSVRLIHLFQLNCLCLTSRKCEVAPSQFSSALDSDSSQSRLMCSLKPV